jgi:uncharacterized membrane protein (UPF0127 family)
LVQRRWISVRRIRGIFFLLLILSVIESYAQSLPRVPLYIKNKEIRVEVAKTPEERAMGLMGRTHLGKDEGMLFIFDAEGYHAFWMKNTHIPLAIAFIDKEYKIVKISEMKPLTLNSHAPLQPILYALEMGKGWFSANGIKAGDVVRFSK